MNLLVSIFLFALAWTSNHCNQRDKVFFLQKSSGNEKLLVVTWTESEDDISAGCEIFTDKDLIDKVLKSSGEGDIRTLSEDQLKHILEDCTEVTLRRRRRETQDERTEAAPRVSTTRSANDVDTTTETESTTAGYDGIPVIFPGTKWCGAGDRAKNYDDLGLHQDTDRCCRSHDLCNDTLAPGETRNNLTNKSPFTKLSCKCDMDFYDCLDRINSVTSNTIGNMYFNVLKRECYEKHYPMSKKCKKYRTFLKLTCMEYEKDTSKPKSYQWVSAKKYKKIPFPGPLTFTIPF